jgi:hypothetical protein
VVVDTTKASAKASKAERKRIRKELEAVALASLQAANDDDDVPPPAAVGASTSSGSGITFKPTHTANSAKIGPAVKLTQRKATEGPKAKPKVGPLSFSDDL